MCSVRSAVKSFLGQHRIVGEVGQAKFLFRRLKASRYRWLRQMQSLGGLDHAAIVHHCHHSWFSMTILLSHCSFQDELTAS